MLVLKFGGSSVADAVNISRVLAIIAEKSKHDRLVVVVSALGGVTDSLLHAGKFAAEDSDECMDLLNVIRQRHLQCIAALIKDKSSTVSATIEEHITEIENLLKGIRMIGEISPRIFDKIAGFGELMSSKIIAAALKQEIPSTQWLDSRSMIITNDHFGNAQVDFESTNQKIRQQIGEDARVYLCPGFIASTSNGLPTTLGRGGSDYTAAILAAGLEVTSLEIWTDVSGMMTADPRLCAHVRIIPEISYQEAMELSHFGAKVIYPPTIQPVMKKNIPVWIKNTFAPGDAGTRITDAPVEAHKTTSKDKHIITGISSIGNISLITLQGSGMIGIAGFSKRFFEALSNEQINVILITQSSSEHSITVAIEKAATAKADAAVRKMFEPEIASDKVDPPLIENDLSVVAIVGDQMRNHTGISGKMFHAMGRNGINIRAIAQGSSEMNISAVIQAADVRKTINVLHEEFFESSYKQVHLFIAGAGNVGKKLMSQLQQQAIYLQNQMHIQIKLAGMINSRKMFICEEGVDWNKWEEALEKGIPAAIGTFTSELIGMNARNAVFADITASDEVAGSYESLLQKSISVVACNKVAASSDYEYYLRLKSTAREYNTRFLFETNVGAGLPIIGTISDLISSGDRIHRMEAVLSGTLNFVFNHYDGSRSFADVVAQAQAEGYTEPDPRLDLGGKDVMRKILILAREAGYALEMADIQNNSFMPEACMQGSVEDFYQSMKAHESHFQELYQQAFSTGHKLKFVASFNDGKATVGLQPIPPTHDLFHLYGKDNVVLFYTDRYRDQPLVIKGAGAGAEVTASGVFADILRAIR